MGIVRAALSRLGWVGTTALVWFLAPWWVAAAITVASQWGGRRWEVLVVPLAIDLVYGPWGLFGGWYATAVAAIALGIGGWIHAKRLPQRSRVS